MTPSNKMLWLPIALVCLALSLSGQAQAADADPSGGKLAELSRGQLAEAIAQVEADDLAVAADERRLMEQLGASMPDGVVKNQLRRLNMKHILHLDSLERLKSELARRQDAPAA